MANGYPALEDELASAANGVGYAGFLFQHHAESAADVEAFLTGAS